MGIEILGIDKLFSLSPAKRMGRHRECGRAMCGFSVCGEESEFWFISQCGAADCGKAKCGDYFPLTGIWRRDNVTGKVLYYCEPFYIPKNRRTETQQTNRQKYADGVLAWQGLTGEQKAVYNEKAKNLEMSGYNLFLKLYLHSH